jgi:MoaA/NifB/PqqE/SkfB family radical SAM enzyme
MANSEIIGAGQNTAHRAPKIPETGFSEITNERILYDGDGFWYCEIAVTGRCSFSCSYCNRLKSEIKINQVYDFIENYKCSLRHIQLTGGEPTEFVGIRDLCTFIKDRNIKTGLSTNGSAEYDVYDRLDVDMFSISLDDYDIGILGKRGYKNISRVIDNIRRLSQRSYVNVGLVVDSINVKRVNNIIDFILGLGVSDIKLSINTHDAVIPKFENKGYEKYPILNYRINRFRAGKLMRGLAEEDTFKCALSISDISIVGENHYPCLVYAREGGAPIGPMGENIKTDRITWYNNHNPYNDSICKKYCMDFKCEFNREKELIRALRSPAQDTMEICHTAPNSAMLQGLKPHAGGTGTSA